MNRHERRRLQTRKKLTGATVELILEKGFDAITVQDITDRADVGRGSFYIYFKSKEDIVWSIVQEGLDAADRQAHQQIAGELPPHPEYHAYQNIFRHAEQNRDLYRVMLGSQGSALLTHRAQQYLTEDFIREMKQFQLSTPAGVPLEIWAQIIVGAVIRLVIWWLETPNAYTTGQMTSMLYETLHHKTPNPTG